MQLTNKTNHVTIDALALDMISALNCAGLSRSRSTVRASFNGAELILTGEGVLAVIGEAEAMRCEPTVVEIVGAYNDAVSKSLR